jgi:hypothetical protein
MNDNRDTAATRHNNQLLAHSRVRSSADTREIHSIDPARCLVWSRHPRSRDRVTVESCRDLIRTIEMHGQLVPALGRPTRNDPCADVEILCGSRRLFVARHLGIPLLVQVRNLSNSESAVIVEVENRIRRNLSRNERGVHYKQLAEQPLRGAAAGTRHPRDYDMMLRTSTGKPLFTARRYFNVLELVFPQSVDDLTVELINSVVADILDVEQPQPPIHAGAPLN